MNNNTIAAENKISTLRAKGAKGGKFNSIVSQLRSAALALDYATANLTVAETSGVAHLAPLDVDNVITKANSSRYENDIPRWKPSQNELLADYGIMVA